MLILTPVLVFLLFSSGLYLIMKRNLFEILLGVNLVSYGTNLMLLSMGGWNAISLPPILTDVHGPDPVYADPIPQALILTAIVISFAVTAFLVVLTLRGLEATGTLEVGEAQRGEDEE